MEFTGKTSSIQLEKVPRSNQAISTSVSVSDSEITVEP